MECFLIEGSQGFEVEILTSNLRSLGFDILQSNQFTSEVTSAVKMFQQSSHDHFGAPLKIDGRLGALTAIAIDQALGKTNLRTRFDDEDLPAMSVGGSQLARMSAQIAAIELARASGEQGGDNFGADVARFQADGGQKGRGWSAAFAAFCYREAGETELFSCQSGRSALHLLERAWTRGTILSSLDKGLLPGDIIVWHFHDPAIPDSPNWQGHAGLVWSSKIGQVVTIEGDRGTYPSLVRSYTHQTKSLTRSLSDLRLREGISVVRIP